MDANRVFLHRAALAGVATLLCVAPVRSLANGADVPYEIDSLQPGERALVALPIEFDVLPTNRLYVDGILIERAELTVGEGDSLLLNGVPILPHRPCPKSPPLPDEVYEQVCGSVPYYQALVESGASPREAGDAYHAARIRVFRRLKALYLEARQAGESKDAAGATAFEALREVDEENLVDWDGEVSQSQNFITITWKGMDWADEFQFRDPLPDAERPRQPKELTNRHLATRLYELLAERGAPCWYIITCGGTSVDIGVEAAARAQAQLDAARRTGSTGDGVLSASVIEQILANEGKQDR